MNIDPSALTPDQQFDIARMTIEANHCENMARILSSTHPLGKLGELMVAFGLSDEEGADLLLDRIFPSPKPKRPTMETYLDILQSVTKLVVAYQAMTSTTAYAEPAKPVEPSVRLSVCFDLVLSVLSQKGYGADEDMDDPEATNVEKAQRKAERLLGAPRASWCISDLETLVALVVA